MFTKTGYQKKIAVLEEVNAALEKDVRISQMHSGAL